MVFVGLLVQCLFSAGWRRQQAGLAPFFEAVAFASDVDDGCMMKQPIQHSRRQDCIAKSAAPVAEAFIAGENGAAAFIARRHQLKEECGSYSA